MDNVCSFRRIADVILDENPDVVAIQEVDSATRRSGNKYVLGEIAERTRMHAAYAPAIDHDGGKYGIGILSKKKPLDVQAMPLPGREERRVLMVAEFDDYLFCCTHLSLTEEGRLASLHIINAVAASKKKPFFLAGDMNDRPDSEFIRSLQKDFQVLTDSRKKTFPSPEPVETIDYIFTRKSDVNDLAVLSEKVVNEPVASDHRPVSVRLRLAKRPDELFRTKP